MAFEPKYEKLVASFRKNLSENQARVDVKLATTDGEEVKAILCSSAKAHVVNAELNGNTISYTGEVNFQVIYESVMGDIHGLDYTAEFADKYTVEDESGVVEPIVESVVVDVEIGVLNPTTLTASAIVESRVDVIVNDISQMLVGVNADNVYTNIDNVKYYNYIGKLFEKYDFSQDVELNDSVAKVLSLTPSITIDNVKVNNEFAYVVGNVFVDMCYLTNDENTTVKSYTTSFDFSMEVPFTGLNEDTYIMSSIYINSTDIKVTTNIEDSRVLINLMLPIVYNGYAFNPNTVENIVDLYSTTNELNTVFTSVDTIVPRENVSALEKINGSVMVEDSFVDEILGNCCNYVTITSTSFDGDIVVEGIASTTVLYYNKEENTKNSIIVEMPFSTRIKTDIAYGDVVVNCVMSDISTKSKRGQEIEVFAKLYLYLEVYSNETNVVISEVSLGEEKVLPNCAIRIYIVKDNETIWDIAKKLGTSVEELLAQNPNLELPLKENDRVYMYYQKVMQF